MKRIFLFLGSAAVVAFFAIIYFPEYSYYIGKAISLGLPGHQTASVLDASDPDLQAWYKFDASSGTVATDSSTHGNTGTLSGSSWGAGFIGTGSLASNGGVYVTIPNALEATPVSYSIWFNTVGQDVLLSDSSIPASAGTEPISANAFLYVGIDGHLNGGWAGGYGDGLITSTATVNDGHWHHAVIENNGTNQTLYLDGSLVGTQTAGALVPNNLQIGTGWTGHLPSTYSGWRPFSGSIDDVRVFSRYLNSTDIQTLYNEQYSSSVTADSCSKADVDLAMTHIAPGGTLTIPAGGGPGNLCIWTSTLTVDKPITIQGMGSTSTFITDGMDLSTGQNDTLIKFTSSGAGFTRLTALTVRGGTVADTGSYNHSMIVVATAGTWRIDDIYLYINHRSGITVYSSNGVIDNNKIDIDGYFVSIYGFNGGDFYGDDSWSRAYSLGSGSDPFFVEDNNFTELQTGVTGGGLDGWAGERVVFRYNTLTNAFFGNHGTDSSGALRGGRSYEFYNNNIIYDTVTKFGANNGISLRSGNGVIFGNTFDGNVSDAPFIANNYRDRADFTPYGACDGTSRYDSNDGITYATGTVTADSSVPDFYIIVTDANANVNWPTNQWAGYSVINTTSNVAGSIIVSNTAHTLSVQNEGAPHRTPLTFTNTNGYKILRASICLDQTGRGAGSMLDRVTGGTSSLWPNQAAEQTYVWGNTQNAAPISLISGSPHIVDGRDFFNDACPANYTPYTYPNPLTGSSAKTVTVNCPGQPSPSDLIAPIISGVVSSSITSNSALITWITDEPADSQVEYGLTTAYGNSTTLDATLGYSHSVVLTGLSADTTYNYRLRTKDGSSNLRVSSNQTFSTISATISYTPSGSGGGGGASTGGGGGGGGNFNQTFLPTTPAATPTTPVYVPITPLAATYPNLTSSLYFGLSGPAVTLVQNILVLEGFIPAKYATGFYGTITQSAVAAFQAKYSIVNKGTPETTGLGLVGAKTRALMNSFLQSGKYPSLATGAKPAGSNITAPIPTAQTPALTPTYIPTTGAFTTPLSLGMTSADVKRLQIFLNSNGFIVAKSGNGSPGYESTYYGPSTQYAVMRFQNAHAAEILAPYGLTKPTGYFGTATMKVVNSLR